MEIRNVASGKDYALVTNRLIPPSITCLHRRFEWHADRHPNDLAVVEGTVRSTYAEINVKANRLAQQLIHQGVKAESLVGVCFPRSHEFVVAVLAILKAGGAYVPLDPEHPEERTLGLVDSAKLRLVITNHPINWPTGCDVIDPSESAEENDANIDSQDDPDRLLYVIHTSGSTGAPKGVLVTHQNVARLFDMLRHPLKFSADDCWSFYHSPAFGYSAWEIWGAISLGGTLAIFPKVNRLSGPDFIKHLRDASVTILSLTPSAFRHHLLDNAFAEINTLPALRMVALSGEAPVAADLKKWFEQVPTGSPELVSTYAITETGGQVSWRTLLPGDSDASWMGNVLGDTKVLVLDDSLRPVPVGNVGEICVAGPGLARGYLNQPELTRAKFIQDPFGKGSEERIYRTGDRARIRDDGAVELVGRADDQVKLGGHRIELGEIEAVLREHPSVAEAAVIVREDHGTHPCLVGYVVAHAGTDQPAPSEQVPQEPEFWPSIGEYQVYDEVLYHFMSNEPVRTSAYRLALEQHSKDKVVLDIGTGQDALLARYAAEAGARKVYAIEVLEDAAHRARKLVEGLGLQDRITVISGDSGQISLPEPVDVWTQGIIGNIGSSDGIIPIANDARRWMNPGAIAIPSQCVTFFAAVELPLHMREKPSFGPLARQYAEHVFDKFGRKFDIRLCVRNFPHSQLISDKAPFEDLDFSDHIEPDFRGKHTFTVNRDACFDGFILWTYVTTTQGVTVDFLEHQQAWLPIYFPLADDGWHLKQGASIDVEWQRLTSANGLNPDYDIQATVRDKNGQVRQFTYRSCHHEKSYMGNGVHRRLFEGWDKHPPMPTQRQLRSHLARKLPDYMLPSAFVFLDNLPLNANGKLDRKTLPAPGSQRPEMTTPYRSAESPLESKLVQFWQEVLGLEGLGTDDGFFELGGSSLQAISITNRIQVLLGEYVYVLAIFDAPTVKSLAEYLVKHYPVAISNAFPETIITSVVQAQEPSGTKLQLEDELAMRALLRTAAKSRKSLTLPRKNPRAAFILSTHRSGSTLFRIMLAGHPQLFAPPELELLEFDTLSQRKETFSGRDSYWMEGTIRAIMQLRNCPVGDAEKVMSHWEAQNLSTPEFYHHLQHEATGRLLIDKSTHYALNPDALRKAEEWFDEPLYIHLQRHPCGSIQSYLDTRMEFFFRHEHQFSRFHLAELNWLISQRNILDFLKDIPAHRQLSLRFEDLVAAPQPIMEQTCHFLNVPFHPALLDPYGDPSVRMTDAIYEHSRMLGDIKFAGHKKINPNIADRWKGKIDESLLGEMTWTLARQFGYHESEQEVAQVKTNALFEPLPRPADAPLVLSFSQKRFWFLRQLEELGHAQNITGWVHFRGPLQANTLQEAIRRVVARHESLRSRYTECSGQPALIIDSEPNFGWQYQDLSGLAAPLRQQVLDDTLSQQCLMNFDLEHGPLLRFELLKFEEDDFALIRCFHHVCTDGWSMDIFNHEVSVCYRALLQGIAPPLPPLALQYSDFAWWQGGNLQANTLQRQLDYWQSNLAEAPTLQLPSDHPRPNTGASPCKTYNFSLPISLVAMVQAFSQKQGVTPFMTLLAAYQVLLARHSGQNDILVGAPSANRRHPAWEQLIGFFINTIIIRTNLEGEPNFNEVVSRVRAQSLLAFKHQDVPFDRLVEEINPKRDLSRHPFAQVMFQLREGPKGAFDLPGITTTVHPAPGEATHFDQYLSIKIQPGEWNANLSWRADLFEDATMHRMAGHFVQLLEGLLEQPGRACSEINMLSQSERHQLLAEWNDTAKNYDLTRCVHHLMEAQASRTPNQIAVTFGTCSLTYSELNAKSNQLALRLRELGIGRGACVPVLLERSLELVISELAVMKTGAAFVPMDPNWPTERSLEILAQCNPRAVLTSGSSTILGHHCIPVAEKELTGNPENLNLEIEPTDPIYVIFTSGSTGRPKGAINQHLGIVNRFFNMTDRFGCDAGDRILATTAPIFDSAVWQYFWPLTNGARTILPSPENGPDEIFSLIQQWDITLTDFVPSVFDLFVKKLSTNPDQFLSVRQLIVGGEEISLERVRQFRKLRPETGLTNAYGPTETSIGVIFYDVPREPGHLIPIGKPLHNVQAVIVDRNLQIVPIGVAGELCIGGVCVGLGYLNAQELTDANFVNNPFPELATPRLYRTGDLARFLPDGNIDFLGRMDYQVKIRSYRIELGDVESALLHQPEVADAVALVRQDKSGEKSLTAYLVSRSGQSPDASKLRAQLSDKLPHYMIPARFFVLPALPTTPAGKLDRNALESLENGELPVSGTSEPPRNHRERELIEIWQSVLNRDQVGIHDNFFDLGGHSLLALKLFSVIREVTGTSLPIRALFDFPTVASLGTALAKERKRVRQGGNQLSRHLVSLRTGDPTKPHIILIPGGWGGDDDLKFFSELLSNLPGDSPVIGVHSRLLDPKYPFPENLPTRVKRLLKEVLEHTKGTLFHLIAECVASVIAIEIARKANADKCALGRLILLEFQAPIRLPFFGLSRLRTQMGKSDPHRKLPAAIRKYYHLLVTHHLAEFSWPTDLVVATPPTSSVDHPLSWHRLLPILAIHKFKNAAPDNLLKMALGLLETNSKNGINPAVQMKSQSQGPHLVTLHQGDGKTPPLVILPGGAGGENELLIFARLIRHLPSTLPVLGVDMQLMNTRVPFPASIATRAQEILAELMERTGPNGFHLLGECHAGAMAFELAQQTRQAGHKILSFIMLDSVCPSRWRSFRRRWFPKRYRPAHKLSPGTDLSLLAQHKPSASVYLERYVRMLHAYRPQPLDLPVHLISAHERDFPNQTTSGWENVVTICNTHVVHGTHDSYIRENAPITAQLISTIISESNT